MTVGAKVSDFLRRKEPTNHSIFGVTEVNERAGAALSCGQGTLLDGQDQANGTKYSRSLNPHFSASFSWAATACNEESGALIQNISPANKQKPCPLFYFSLAIVQQTPTSAIPRLNPPPLSTKKRTPRALKTTQDMLIASQPQMEATETSLPEEGRELQCPPTKTEAAFREVNSLTQVEVGTSCNRALDVPDLIHKENVEPKQSATHSISSSTHPENVALRLSLSASKSLPEHQSCMDPSEAKALTLESEGHSPDLLSFE
ncbi:uncharacterized protein C1orf226 homolog [Candoia aspera]|uniref:uncharacterized protein C1orf226 homolog n=1 Tax=Candoia aspera TaxID=51853 RepID=UPI002FD84F67